MWAGVGAAILLIAEMAPALAAAAPELLNKTIHVRYTVTTPSRRDDGTGFVAINNAVRTVYISSAGRAFGRGERMNGSDRTSRETKEAGPDERGNTIQLQGRKLVGHMKFDSGAAHMEVDVDPGGSSCRASVIFGRDGGRPLRWKGVNGMMATATGPMTASNISCSVSAGNGLAQ